MRIKFKKRKPKDYSSLGNHLYCRGVIVKEFESAKAAKLAAERWNSKHELNLQPCTTK